VSTLSWTSSAFFYLLPLALLPWLIHNQSKTIAWSKLLPIDPISKWINLLLKTIASLIIISLILALAGPHIPEQTIERYGEGAEFIVLLDRSRSMDEIFARPPLNTLRTERLRFKSKRVVSTDYLLEFVEGRPDDRFGYVYFSTQSVEILPLTYNKDAILATIRAGGLGKGISKTDIVEALQLAAKMYENESYRGSRNVLLISDGGQILSNEEQRLLKKIYEQMNLNLYWIYLRSVRGMTLDETTEDSVLWEDLPERKLHAFFKTLQVPYQAYEAGSLAEYAAAIADIDKQQYQPLLVAETIPKQSKADVFLLLALSGLLILVVSFWLSYAGVRQAYRRNA
jgi:mxaC protein